jgi:glutamyl/glutaminyl-tRNA synthetase
VQETLKILDWLDISLDFNDKFKNSIFETQRNDNYNKWLKYLIGQKDAYKCFCKSYKKCEKHCSDSRENIDSEDFKDNKDVMYIRFKNQNRNYKYYDYMSYEDIEFDSSSMGDFLLYKNFNGLFLDSFKRVIDDDMYSVTHIIEEKVNTTIHVV